jgi:hypothetical protein
LAAVAYLAGRWQRELAATIQPEPRVRNAASRELAARAAARAKAEALYQKLVDGSTPAAKNNGIDLAKDLKGGLAKLAAMPPGAKAQQAYQDAFDAWAKDPTHSADAAAVAEALPASLERTSAMKGVAEGWAEADPQKCLDWASNLPTTNADVLKEALVDVSAPRNDNRQPALAAQYVDKLQDASLRNEAIQEIAVNWGSGSRTFGFNDGADPAAALDWLNQVATGEIYDKTVNEMVLTIGINNPALASTMIDKIADPDVHDEVANDVATLWGRAEDADAALQWAQNLPDSDQAIQDKVMNSLIGRMALKNPVAAAALVENSPNPAQFLSSASTIATGLATVDPQAALTWTDSLPDGDTKNKTLNNVLMSMSESDFSGAWNYAANLTDASLANSITSNLVGSLAQKDPTQAAALVGQLPSGDAQINATSSLATTWAAEDTQGFANWVNTLPAGAQHDAAVSSAVQAVQNLKLPAPEQAELLQSLNQAVGGKSAP